MSFTLKGIGDCLFVNEKFQWCNVVPYQSLSNSQKDEEQKSVE